MAYTERFDFTSGLTLYGKAKPLDTSPWSDGVIALTENGTTGEYSASTFLDDIPYSVYIQAGESPASTDNKIGTIYPSTTGSGTSATAEEIAAATLALINADATQTTARANAATAATQATSAATQAGAAATQTAPAAIRTAVGLESANLASLVQAVIGKKTVTDNGNGTYDIAIRNTTDTTTLITIRHNPVTGATTVV